LLAFLKKREPPKGSMEMAKDREWKLTPGPTRPEDFQEGLI
jgi:hypothetical protein